MEERFFDSIGDAQQNAAAAAIKELKRDRAESPSRKKREGAKGSYTRNLAERLREKAKA